MAGYRPTQIRKPSDETDFEKNCVVLFKEVLADPNVKRVGTRGQKQKGVDVIGKRNRDSKQPVGVQCKLKLEGSKLSDTEVKTEVEKALTFRPKLTEYFIVTTSKDDTTLDELVKQLSQEQDTKGRRIHIEVWGWDTLSEKINQSEAAKEAFDPGF
jgi:Restriction endonuclease